MKRIAIALVAAALAVPAFAQSGMKDMEMKGMEMKKAAEGKQHKGAGVVKSVDAKKGTVTLAHDPIESMSWPAMTMTFKAKDKAMLEQVKPGAKVKFSFVQSGKDYVVTEIK